MTKERELSPDSPNLKRIALLFLKLGVTAFGGPAAHIALMEEEFVTRRRWIRQQDFLDMMGATQLIPGPNSTEMAIHLGYRLRSYPGLVLAGACFILPAALLMLILAMAYQTWGRSPAAELMLSGFRAAAPVLILGAMLRLGPAALKRIDLWVIAALTFVFSLWFLSPVALLLGAGVAGMLWRQVRLNRTAGWALLIPPVVLYQETQFSTPLSLSSLAIYFLKVGSVLFGSGYVLIAYLEQGLVEERGWITANQLLDAVALGQLTPGPVLTTATFVGHLLLGWEGAVVATGAIFLPSFVFVLGLQRVLPRLRGNPWTSGFLDSVNAAAVALMASVIFQLTRTILKDWQDWTILSLALLLFFVGKVRGARLVLACGLLGLVVRAVAHASCM